MAPHTPAIKQFAWQQQLLLLQLRQQQCRLLAKLSDQASRKFGHSWSMESRQVASDKNVAIVRLLVVVSIVAAVAVSIVVAVAVACYCQRFVIMHIIVAAVVAAALHAVVPAACWAIKEALPHSHTATEKVQQQQQQQQPVTCNHCNNNNCYCNCQQHSQTSCRRRH